MLESSEPGNDTYSLANVMIIGGSGDDSVGGIALATDSIFNTGKGAETEPGIIVFVGGTTDSADFPMLGPLAGGTQVFVLQIAELNPTGPPGFAKGPVPPIPPHGIINAASFGIPGATIGNRFNGFGTAPHLFTPGFPPCPLGFPGIPPGSGFCPPGFPGFPPGHPGFPGSPVFDHNGDGIPNIIFFGGMGINGPNPFNNITMLNAATLELIAQWEVERTGGDSELTTATYDSQTGNIVFAGHADQDLADAETPGNPGVFKSFVGAVPVLLVGPQQSVTVFGFLDDGTLPGTDVFSQAAVIRPKVVDEQNPTQVFVAGTWVPNVGPVIGYVGTFGVTYTPLSEIDNYRTLKERTNANYTDLEIGGNLNLLAYGHEFKGQDERDLILDELDINTGFGQDSLRVAGPNMFAQRSAFMTDGTGFTGFAGGAGGLPTSPGAPQPNNSGGFDGYIFKTEDLDLNPLAIVTAGGFKGAPFVPYGIYTAFFDWPRIPGLIQPPLVDNKFPKEAGGMVVKLNGEPTAITAVSNRQVNFIAHNDVDQNPTATLQLCYTDPVTGKTFESNIATMPAQSSWVNPFEIGDGVAAFHSNGVMTRENRQHRDDFLAVVATGGGGFGNPSIEADEITPAGIFRFDNIPEFKAVVGGREFEVQVAFGGLLPGLTVGGAQYNLIFSDEFWVFACAATTNVEYTLTVTDTVTGSVRTYENDLGQAAQAVTDTDAFATCP